MTTEKTDFHLLFPDNRRDGETVLRQAQLVMLRMLKIIDYICRKHQLRYWLCSGTLLGAVRHQGFIPWDDDLDICMPREDYERFLQVASAEFPDELFLQTRATDPNYHFLPLPCKVRDRKSYILAPGYEDEKSEKGLFVDIFPMDKYHKGLIVHRMERGIKAYYRFICNLLGAADYRKESHLKNLVAYFYPVSRLLWRGYAGVARFCIDRNRRLGDNCFIGHGFDTPWKRYFRYEDIYPLRELRFEDALFYVPNRPDVYLTELYGSDYMTPPATDKQVNSHASVIRPVL